MTDISGREQLAGYRLRGYNHAMATLTRSRDAQHITIAALARSMRRDRTQVSSWLLGDIQPAPPRLFELAAALGYDLALIPREDAEPQAAACGCPVTYERARVERHTRECGTRRSAERLAAHLDLEHADADAPSACLREPQGGETGSVVGRDTPSAPEAAEMIPGGSA